MHYKKFLFQIFILTWKCITTFAINKTQFLPCEKHYSHSMVIEWWYLDDGNTRTGKCMEGNFRNSAKIFFKKQCLIAMQMGLKNLVHLYSKKKKEKRKKGSWVERAIKAKQEKPSQMSNWGVWQHCKYVWRTDSLLLAPWFSLRPSKWWAVMCFRSYLCSQPAACALCWDTRHQCNHWQYPWLVNQVRLGDTGEVLYSPY